jgi:hypothetical protein
MTLPVVCYLCSKAIAAASSRDHVVPKQLRDGQAPKVRGFEHGGYLPTHKKCNNEFGLEAFGQRALELLDVLHRDDCFFDYRHPNDSSIRLMALRADCLPNFGRREMRYFRISDRRKLPTPPTPAASELKRAPPLNPRKHALDVALAVLLKSAAALAIKKRLHAIPQSWQVMAVPYVGDAHAIDLDSLFGQTKPLGPRVKVWAAPLVTGDVLVAYRASSVLVLFFFRFSRSLEGWRHMRGQFLSKPRLRFDGSCISDVLRSGWKQL